jgi:hypothetical protein
MKSNQTVMSSNLDFLSSYMKVAAISIKTQKFNTSLA